MERACSSQCIDARRAQSEKADQNTRAIYRPEHKVGFAVKTLNKKTVFFLAAGIRLTFSEDLYWTFAAQEGRRSKPVDFLFDEEMRLCATGWPRFRARTERATSTCSCLLYPAREGREKKEAGFSLVTGIVTMFYIVLRCC